MAEAKERLRITGDSFDADLASLLRAARQEIDGSSGWLGRALITQTWDLLPTSFPTAGWPIYIPLPPLQSVTSISYVDAAGATQTIAASEYRVLNRGTAASLIEPVGGDLDHQMPTSSGSTPSPSVSSPAMAKRRCMCRSRSGPGSSASRGTVRPAGGHLRRRPGVSMRPVLTPCSTAIGCGDNESRSPDRIVTLQNRTLVTDNEGNTTEAFSRSCRGLCQPPRHAGQRADCQRRRGGCGRCGVSDPLAPRY